MARRPVPALAAALCLIVPASAAADGRVRTVDDDGAQCRAARYTAIQDALDAARPGDLVKVCAGRYRGPVTIGARVRVENWPRHSATVEVAAGTAVRVAAGGRVQGLRVRAASADAAVGIKLSGTGTVAQLNRVEGFEDGIVLTHGRGMLADRNTVVAPPGDAWGIWSTPDALGSTISFNTTPSIVAGGDGGWVHGNLAGTVEVDGDGNRVRVRPGTACADGGERNRWTGCVPADAD